MLQMNSIGEKLVFDFTENYMGKLFYFCLKRTGDSYEAEDLTSDITLNILSALKKGVVPVNFSAWVWQIARNRYSVWADKKHKHRETVSGADIGDCEIEDTLSVEDELIHSEELALLRRELAFIASDYRNILVAYYIENRSIKDIAASENLPSGTVKSKLFRARNILKEGMNMAREFGKKSYNPEEVRFLASGNQPSGLPWSAVQRKIPKNILLQASNNPSTVNELAVELGTAVPYMEEEAELLVQSSLLKKIGNQYITNFYIMDKDTQLKIYQAQREHSKERSEMLDKIFTDTLTKVKKLHVIRNGMSDADFKWWAMLYLIDLCIFKQKRYRAQWIEERINGETWGFMGFEQTELPENCTMGHNGVGNEDSMFWAYKICGYDLWERAGEMNSAQVSLLGDMIRNRRRLTSLSFTERKIWEKIDGRFAHADADGNIIPDIVVLEKNTPAKLDKIYRAHPLFKGVMENIRNAFDKTVEILKANSSEVLHNQLDYYASMEIFDIRMMMVNDEIESGGLLVPENPSESTIAMCIEVK